MYRVSKVEFVVSKVEFASSNVKKISVKFRVLLSEVEFVVSK